jgi:predicted nucleotidyltransferase
MADAMSTLETLFAERPVDGVMSVYGFGSLAAGRGHRESDVDVGVLLDRAIYPDRAQRFDARLRLTASIASALGRNDIDLVVLNDAPPHLGRAIVTRGRRIYVRNEDVDRAFQRDVQLRAADLDPFLRRTRRIKLAAILR